MEANKILNADFLDILFEGRNKEYGAYELRKAYNKRMARAIIIMLALCVLIAITSIIAKTIGDRTSNQMVVQDVQLEDIKQPDKQPPPPPPPPKDPPKVEVTKFTPPKIVKDEEVKPEEKPPEQDKLEDTKIGAFNQEGDKDVVEAPKEVGTGQVEAPKTDDQDYDKEFTSVQVEAKFPGDWGKFLERNLNSQVPADNGAPPGNYTVTVSFLVDKDGNISQVQALTDPGYGCAKEAIRVIQKGPKWNPAIQNGRNVIYRQKQNITFQVTDQ